MTVLHCHNLLSYAIHTEFYLPLNVSHAYTQLYYYHYLVFCARVARVRIVKNELGQ